jgi:hypothetical protein
MAQVNSKNLLNQLHCNLVYLHLLDTIHTYEDLARLAGFLDCYEEHKFSKGVIEGLMDELFQFLSPKNSDSIFFFWEVSRYIEEVMPTQAQYYLLEKLKHFPISYINNLTTEELS